MNLTDTTITLRLSEDEAFRQHVKRDVGLDVADLEDGGGKLTVHYRVRRLRFPGDNRLASTTRLVPPTLWAEHKARALADPRAVCLELLEVTE